MAVLQRHAQGRRIILKIVNLSVLPYKEFEVLSSHSKFFEKLKFVFLSEVSGLIRLNKIHGAPMKSSELF